MVGRSVKTSQEQWIEAAKQALVEDGIGGVKVDRLAKRLKVTRGGFYHNFGDREDLLARLLEEWEKRCQFIPAALDMGSAHDAVTWLEDFSDRLIVEDTYDHLFDLAVREWARSDQRAAWAINRADRQRIESLASVFGTLGCDEKEAQVRARVFYYHQIGYYAINAHETVAARRRSAPLYLDILCGRERLEAARQAGNEGDKVFRRAR